MASTSEQMISSSSSSMPRSTYNVFLSFRGEDTRSNFTSHLYKDLVGNGIRTFRDDEEVERGGAIQSQLSKAIEESTVFVVIFSKNYANSRWCLDELVKIVERMNGNGRTVLPVFYGVDPSNVRRQTGSYEKAFADHEIDADQEKKEKIEDWRRALTKVGNLSGYHLQKCRFESELIDEIVADILKRVNPRSLHVDKNIVGKDSYLMTVEPLLNLHLVDVRVVGIYGIGGIGKTTIAKIVYNDILREFEGSCFIEDIKERFKDYSGRLQLLEEIFHSILSGKSLKLYNASEGFNMIKDNFCSKKMLLVLDDVNHLDQLKLLLGSREWFASGSRIIITTRDRHLLDVHGVDELYEAKGLDHMEAIQLFSRHAFKREVPETDYADLSNSVVHYAQGNPLALKVLGSLLFGGTIDEWQSTLERLKKRPNKDIHKVLKISFDGLTDDRDKEIFLDIACFLKGQNRDFISRIHENCDVGIRVLCDRCLIYISNNKIHMHDLIQQMGQEIVREKFPGEPSKWSRLWDPDDIYRAFSRKEPMKKIEVLSMDLSLVKKEIKFDTKAFAKMKRLRLLKVHWGSGIDLKEEKYRVLLPQDFKFPSYELRYLYWDGYSLKSLPSDFDGENLVELHLKYSNIRLLLEGNKLLEKLSIINLSCSEKLSELPNLSSVPNLKELILDGCTSLQKVDAATGGLKKLMVLSLRRCKELESLPQNCKLESLEILDLSYCSKFEKFPEMQGDLEHLKELRLRGTAIKELPSSIGCLESLQRLDLKDCPNLHKLPEMHENMRCLEAIYLDGSGIKELPSSIGNVLSLRHLSLSHCSNFDKFPEIQRKIEHMPFIVVFGELLPSADDFIRLEELDLSGCRNLRSLPGSICRLKYLYRLKLIGCSNLEAFPEITANMDDLKMLYLDGTAIGELPSSIDRLNNLKELTLSSCKNLATLPSTLGNLSHLEVLGLSGCNLMEGGIPSAIWSLYSLEALSLRRNSIRSIPSAITNLRNLRVLKFSHCKMLEEIPELPSSLQIIEAHDCPRLQALSTSTTLFASSIHNCLKSAMQAQTKGRGRTPNSCGGADSMTLWDGVHAVIPGNSGIPEGVRHQNVGSEIRMQLPTNWFRDKDMLGFAFFSLYDPLHVSGEEFYTFGCGLTFRGGEFVCKRTLWFHRWDWSRLDFPSDINCGRAIDPLLWLTYRAKDALELSNPSCAWILEAHFFVEGGLPHIRRPEFKRCGIHLIYAQHDRQKCEVADFGNLKRRLVDSLHYHRLKAPKTDLSLSLFSL